MNILVKDFCDGDTMSYESGYKIHNAIMDAISSIPVDEKIVVDFDGVDIATGSFLGIALVSLTKEISPSILNERVKVINTSPVVAYNYHSVVKNQGS